MDTNKADETTADETDETMRKNSRKARTGWDSNPRDETPPAGFQDRCFKPLSHPSLPLVWGLPASIIARGVETHSVETHSVETPALPQGQRAPEGRL